MTEYNVDTVEEVNIDEKLLKAVKYKQLGYAVAKILLSSENTLMSIPDAVHSYVEKTVEESYSKKLPLVFNITFGSYKSFRVPSHTYPNWAEVFNIRFMLRVLSKVSAIYPFGVQLEYDLQDLFMDKLNAIPDHEVGRYASEFKIIVDFYKNFYPNVGVVVRKYSELISSKPFEKNIQQNVELIKELWRDPSNLAIKNAALERAKRNNRKENLSEEELLFSALYHAAYIKTCMTLGIQDPNRCISFVNRKNLKSDIPYIPYRSCETAAVQFWVGEGVLIKKSDTFTPTILSSTQLEKVKKIGTVQSSRISYLNPNLNEIPVYE